MMFTKCSIGWKHLAKGLFIRQLLLPNSVKKLTMGDLTFVGNHGVAYDKPYIVQPLEILSSLSSYIYNSGRDVQKGTQ